MPTLAANSTWPTGTVTERPKLPPRTFLSGTYSAAKPDVKKSILRPALRMMPWNGTVPPVSA
jgi:hypothetical protein